MTVTASGRSKTYAIAPGVTGYAVTFPVIGASDLFVYAGLSAAFDPDAPGALLTEGVHYTITGSVAAGSGSIVPTTAFPAAGYVTLYRITAMAQTAAYTPNDGFPAKSHEAQLDRLSLVDQELAQQGGDTRSRALLAPAGEAGGIMPTRAARAGRLAAWLDSGSLGAIDALAGLSGQAPVIMASRLLVAAIPVPSEGASVMLAERGREGLFLWRSGNHSTQIAADPLQGMTIAAGTDPTGTTGAWLRTTNEGGRPEWFGAVPNDPTQDCRTALAACTTLCQTTWLDSADYYIKSQFQFAISNHTLEGRPGNRDGGGGSRIILTGPNCYFDTIFQFGTPMPADQSQCVTRTFVRSVAFVRDVTTKAPRGCPTIDPIDCVKGVVVSGLLDGGMSDCVSVESPVGFHFYSVVQSQFDELVVQRTTPCVPNTGTDFYVAFLNGGYSQFNGYVGANASIYFHKCRAFTQNPAFVNATFMRLFGCPADTFVDRCEMSLMKYGFEIDGRTRLDTPGGPTVITNMPGNCQDIRLTGATADGILTDTGRGIYIHDLSSDCAVQLNDTYLAEPAGASIEIINIAYGGTVTIGSGQVLNGGGIGIIATNCTGISISEQFFIRNCAFPVVWNNVQASTASPKIFQQGVRADKAFKMLGCTRNRVSPAVYGGAGLVGVGVSLEPLLVQGQSAKDSTYNCIDGSTILPVCLDGVDSAKKVQFNGADARSSSAFTTAGNALVGVTG